MGFQEGSLILDSPTGTYYSGQPVNGRVVFELTKVKKVRGIFLKVRGFCKVHWTSDHTRRENDRTVHYTKNHDSYEEYLNLKMYLVGGENTEMNLNSGKYEYPFSFHLPPTCPSSFEGRYGHVRYELRAVADRPFKVDQEIGKELRVVAPMDLNMVDCKDPVDFEFEQTYCCWCMNSGSSETLVKMPATGYCPGQVIPLEVSCRNPSSVEVSHIRFSIKKDVNYRATHEPDHKNEHDTILEVRKGPVPAHTDRNWTVELKVPDMDYHNLAACSFIDIDYTFKVSVEPDGCHSDSDDSCKIYFGTIPLRGVQDDGSFPSEQLPMTTAAFPPAAFPPAASPYPAPVMHQPISQSPYPGMTSPYPGAASPYPVASPYPGSGGAPYPGPGGSPYPPNPIPDTTTPYPPANPPYPTSNSPFPTPAPYPPVSSPYPPTVSPYPPPYPPTSSPAPGLVNGTVEKSPSPYNSPAAMPMPALPTGAMPYPPAMSPYATASAPEPATPDTDKKNPIQDNPNSSPYNPDFIKK